MERRVGLRRMQARAKPAHDELNEGNRIAPVISATARSATFSPTQSPTRVLAVRTHGNRIEASQLRVERNTSGPVGSRPLPGGMGIAPQHYESPFVISHCAPPRAGSPGRSPRDSPWKPRGSWQQGDGYRSWIRFLASRVVGCAPRCLRCARGPRIGFTLTVLKHAGHPACAQRTLSLDANVRRTCAAGSGACMTNCTSPSCSSPTTRGGPRGRRPHRHPERRPCAAIRGSRRGLRRARVPLRLSFPGRCEPVPRAGPRRTRLNRGHRGRSGAPRRRRRCPGPVTRVPTRSMSIAIPTAAASKRSGPRRAAARGRGAHRAGAPGRHRGRRGQALARALWGVAARQGRAGLSQAVPSTGVSRKPRDSTGPVTAGGGPHTRGEGGHVTRDPSGARPGRSGAGFVPCQKNPRTVF